MEYQDMEYQDYDVYIVAEDIVIRTKGVRKVPDGDAFFMQVRIVGEVLINGKPYHNNDVVTLQFMPDVAEGG